MASNATINGNELVIPSGAATVDPESGTLVFASGVSVDLATGQLVFQEGEATSRRVLAEDSISVAYVNTSAYTNLIRWVEGLGLVVGNVENGALGFNTLQDADGFHVRNGGTALASFLANLIRLGIGSDISRIEFCDGRAVILVQDILGTGRYFDARLFGAEGAYLDAGEAYFGVQPSGAAGGSNAAHAVTNATVDVDLYEADQNWGLNVVGRQRVDGDDRAIGVRAARENLAAVWMGVGSGGINHGLYSELNGCWIMRADGEGNVYTKNSIPLGQTQSANCPFADGFWRYDADVPAKAYRYGNVVTVSGAGKPSAAKTFGTTGTHMFDVPEGFRPPRTVRQVCTGGNYHKWLLTVNPDGTANISRYGTATAAVECAAGTWLPFTVTYVIE